MSGRKKHESLWSVVHSHAKVLEKILEELRDEAPQATEVVRQNDSLQGHVPRIVPVEHGITKPGQWRGLIIANDGEPAYSISFPSVQVARSKMVFTRGISRLAKEDGKIHCEYWIEQEPGSGSPGGLFEEMVRQNIDAIELPIRYKDGGNQWYETTVKLERDVMAPTGIQAEYVAQKKITQPA